MENTEPDLEAIKQNWTIDTVKRSASHKSGLKFDFLQNQENEKPELAVYNLTKWKKALTNDDKDAEDIKALFHQLKKEFALIVKTFPKTTKIKPTDFFAKLLNKRDLSN